LPRGEALYKALCRAAIYFMESIRKTPPSKPANFKA
jgi:hypothetical protein